MPSRLLHLAVPCLAHWPTPGVMLGESVKLPGIACQTTIYGGDYVSRTAMIARKFAVALRQPVFVWLWLVPAWLLIGISSALIAVLPFRRIAPWLGVNLGATVHRPAATPQQAARARLIGRAVSIAAGYAPFRSNCLPQAMAAKALCDLWRVPCAVILGIERNRPEGDLRAHAWTSCGDATPTGGARSFATHVPLSCFVPGYVAAQLQG